MDKNTDRETRDFMNVESFSQLPFIRPNPQAAAAAAAAAKAGAPGGGAIRLFGKEFGADNNNNNDTGDHTPDSSQENNNSNNNINGNNTMSSTTEMSSRRFECHYCCRNFPTSQALGGHQNAHKRERQQAKRAHLQSAMVHGANAAHVYGFMNYSTRLGSGSALPMACHSWNSNNSSSSSSRFYGRSYHQPPINGSPLALWRIPAAAAHHGSPAGYNRERHTPMHQQMTPLELKQTIGSSNSNAQFRLGYESKAEMQDRVSLDLHL